MQLNIITCILKKKTLYFSDIGKVLKLKTYATNQAYSIYLKNARYDKWVKNGTLIWINTYQSIQFTNGKQYNYVHVKKSPCD